MTLGSFLSQLLQLAIALALAPLLVGWVNMCRAWLSNRSAPPLIQPYRTIRKLFMKDAVVAENASPIFRLVILEPVNRNTLTPQSPDSFRQRASTWFASHGSKSHDVRIGPAGQFT